MLAVGINGSPRKTGNTARLMESALEGAGDAGSTTELVNLYDLNYKGCVSCLGCKRRGGAWYGSCVIKDDLTAVLEKARMADVLLLGSPIYYGAMTGAMRSFLERLLFPYMDYAGPDSSLFRGDVKTGLIYTMGMPEERFEKYFREFFEFSNNMIGRDFGDLDVLYAFDRSLPIGQQDNNDETPSERERERRDAEILADREKAYALGNRLAMHIK